MKWLLTYISGKNFAEREQCLDFKRMELECNKYNEKLRIFKTKEVVLNKRFD